MAREERDDPNPSFRLWPGVLIVALQWFATFATGKLAPASMVQFFGMLAGPPLGYLALGVWWMRVSDWPRGRKFLVFLLPIPFAVGAMMLADPSVYQAAYIYGVPILSLAFVGWLALRRVADVRRPVWAWVAILVVVCGGWAVLRTTGVDGDMAYDFKLRWSQTAEEKLLQAQNLAPVPEPVADAAEPVAADDAEMAETSEDSGDAKESAAEPAAEGSTGGDEGVEAETADADADADAMAADAPTSEVALPMETEDPAEWPGLRGPHRDGIVPGVRVATDWSATPPEVLWKRPVGPGWSAFAVDGDVIYTQEQRGEREVVSAYAASTGEPIWQHADEARFWESMAGAGPRATPTLDDGRVYTMGATGILQSLDAETGRQIWQRNLADDTGARLPDWGFSASPLVADGLVVVHGGAPDGKAIAAYDQDTGEPAWFAAAGPLSYCSMHEATLEGVRQFLIATGDGVTSVSPEGEVLWKHEWPAPGGARVVQPAFTDDGDVIVGTSFGMGTRRFSVSRNGDAWTTSEVWTSQGMKPYYNDIVVHEGHVYGFDNRILAALDVTTGERVWKGGRYGNGQLLLLADQDLLLVISDRGELALVRAAPEGFGELATFQAIEGKTWNHLALVDGVLYVRNAEEMAALRLPTG